MAITGKNFCASAWNAFILIMKNAMRFGTAQSIGFIFNFLGVVFITAVNGCLLYVGLHYMPPWKGLATSWIAPCVVAGFEGLVIGILFMSMFSFASDTVLQCFLVDEDMNRGAAKRPAIMNKFMSALEKNGPKKEKKEASGDKSE